MAPAAALVFAGKSVALPAISFLVNKAFNYLNAYFGAKSMEQMRKKLARGMPKIQAVLDVVSPDHVKDKSEALDAWFWQLRDAVEEAEDAIDELEYYELEEKANDRKISDWGSSFAKMNHKVVRSVKHVGFLDKTVKQFTHRDTIKRLMKAIENLDKVAGDIIGIIAVTDHLSEAGSSSQLQGQLVSNDRQTGFMLSATIFVGREKEKQKIITWLTKTSSVHSAEIVTCTDAIPIFSVVGHGGMGKTTLAQSICQEDEVLKHFKVIWVTVSTSFDATSVTSKIIESATKEKPSANHLAPLQEDLKEKLKSIQFLLVLDDVWEDKKIDEWEKLLAPLRKLNTRSKILLTTRMQSVVDMAVKVMKVERDQYLTLKGLEHGENMELFKHHAFSGLNPHNHDLTLIGDQIARKLGGCPLVTKVVGGHLQSNMKPEYWSRFLHKDLEHFKGSAEDIMKVLRLSYYHLPIELQICFRYCSLFAEDYEFKRKELVQMWMGSALISHATSDSITFEDVGEQFLAQLTRKSFFDVKSRVFYGSKYERFVMHDLMHELARNVSFGECARITNPDMFEEMRDTVRHLYVSCIHGFSGEEVKKIPHLKNLRTIIIDDYVDGINKGFVCTLEKIIKSSKSLRLFRSRQRSTPRVAVKFGELKHLRYIYLDRIPLEGICGVAKLYHLNLLLCRDNLQQEAKHVRYLGYLDSLRYATYGACGLGEFPISNLTSLQELDNYWVEGSMGNKLSAIGSLKGLRELELSGLENVQDHEEAIKANLNAKTNLFSLSLNWSRCTDEQNGTDDLVLDHLEPHVNISKLSISGYNGLRLPFWIENPSVKNLVSLSLSSCTYWEDLPSLGELILLKILRLLNLPKLKQIGHPCDVSSRSSMELLLPPNLDFLEVRQCQELRELPILPSSLVKLRIEGGGLTTLPMIGNISSESTEITSSQLLEISVTNCRFLTSLEGSLFEQKLYMGALRELYIKNCIHLESATIPLEEMNRLEKLNISRCPKLRTMRDAKNKLLPSSLTKLCMRQCGHLEFPVFGALQQLTHLSFLCLENCSHLVSLPSAEVFSTSLKSLSWLHLEECENLSSLGGLGSLPSLHYLRIHKCNKLVTARLSLAAGVSGGSHVSGGEEEHPVNPGTSLQIDRLVIDSPSLLLIEPLKSLCPQKLRIEDGREVKSLPERWLVAKSLESLPTSMPDLSSLKELVVHGAEQLQSLPDLPSSLQRLHIHGCHPELEKKVREHASPEWNKISHILRVKIGNAHFIMNKECSEETFNELGWEKHNKLISWTEQQKDEKRPTWWKKLDCLKNSS